MVYGPRARLVKLLRAACFKWLLFAAANVTPEEFFFGFRGC